MLSRSRPQTPRFLSLTRFKGHPMTHAPSLDAFPFHARDKLRYSDTDQQGHLNNAVFATFFETGRVEILYDPQRPVLPEGTFFVVARIAIDFLAEVRWPGEIAIGTGVAGLGRSSIRLTQALFQNGKPCAAAESVVVLMDAATRRPAEIPPEMRERLSAYLVKAEDAGD
ncbi:acyl-CoA thioesterase [Jiella sp. M17.18]|uniref:acyl-CoA thioesterase n=1 Tax=Jiella sp. M17.18 TaxID=3234247 RepID=UPI0034DEABCA